MSKELNIEKSFNETTENYEKLSAFFKQCGESYCNVLNSEDKEIKIPILQLNQETSSVKGTLNFAILRAHFVFTNIDEAFKNYGKILKLSEVFDHLRKNRDACKEESGMLSNKYRKIKSDFIKDSAVLYVNVCELIKKLNETYRDYASSSSTDNIIQPQNSHGSIFHNMNKMVISNKMSKLYSQYLHYVSNYISYRESIKLCNQEITDFNIVHHSNLSKIDESLFQNFLIICLPKVCKGLFELGQNIIEQASNLQEKVNQINFEYDFKDYIHDSNFTFKDIDAPVFKPYNFTSPFAAPDQLFIPRHCINYFPIGIAVALSDFTPKSQNEVDLIKGKSVYLMEKETRKGWMLVMTIPLTKIGFVPFSYLKVITYDINLNQDKILNRKDDMKKIV